VINATTSAQDGSYAFKNLAPGQYTPIPAARRAGPSACRRRLLQPGPGRCRCVRQRLRIKGDLSISGQKYYDINGNGVMDADEPGIPGGDVSLVLEGKVVANTTTMTTACTHSIISCPEHTTSTILSQRPGTHHTLYGHSDAHQQHRGQGQLRTGGDECHLRHEVQR